MPLPHRPLGKTGVQVPILGYGTAPLGHIKLGDIPPFHKSARLLNHDHGPLSLACYDLVSTETLGSPPWLAVRATEWSSRVRPHFMNTRRTMFKTLG